MSIYQRNLKRGLKLGIEFRHAVEFSNIGRSRRGLELFVRSCVVATIQTYSFVLPASSPASQLPLGTCFVLTVCAKQPD